MITGRKIYIVLVSVFTMSARLYRQEEVGQSCMFPLEFHLCGKYFKAKAISPGDGKDPRRRLSPEELELIRREFYSVSLRNSFYRMASKKH